MKREPLVIVDGVRTPFARMGSDLSACRVDELGRVAVSGLLTKTGLDPALVDETIFGCVGPPVDTPNVARVIALRAGLPEGTPAVTVNRNCASGAEASDKGASGAKASDKGSSSVKLSGAKLSGAKLSGAKLRGAKLSGGRMSRCQ